MTRYVHRDALKRALSIDASTTGRHEALDAAAEGVARLFDKHVGFGFHPVIATRDYTAERTTCLPLDYPLLSLDALRTDSSGNASFGTTLATDQYDLAPWNAPSESPPQPYWRVELRSSATGTLPANRRGVRIVGTWGYYDQRTTSTSKLTTGCDSATNRLEFSGATALHPGQTIRLEDEQLTVLRNGLSGSDTATTSGSVYVERARNGTVAAAHASGVLAQLYTYPVIERAALYQAEQDYRAEDAPLGVAGGGEIGTQRPVMAGGLHPFCRRMLDPFRMPVVG